MNQTLAVEPTTRTRLDGEKEQGASAAISALIAESLRHSALADEELTHWIEKKLLPSRIDSRDSALFILNKVIVEIDALLNAQLNEIIHHPKFKKLEASWRGLHYLVETEADYDEDLTVKIKALNVSWKELSKDVLRAIEFDQSQMFQRIYSDEFDMPGGEPFGVLLGDYHICHKVNKDSQQSDIEVLKEVADVAAAALCPFITGVDPSLFGLDSLREFGMPLDLDAIFKQKEYINWWSLRSRESTRFVGLTLPSMLMRQPYRDDGTRFEEFKFIEATQDSDGDYLWGNSCYAFGGVLIRAFANTGWFADIRGGVHDFGEGGVVRNLEYSAHHDVDPSAAYCRAATNIQIDDFLERELSEFGFIPLCSHNGFQNSAYYSNSSLHNPQNYTSDIANSNARLSAMIQYMMCVSRFGHYIKVIGRDKIGSVISAQDCQRVFQNWLNQYTTASDGSSDVLKARYPLAESRVEVKEQPGRVGYFTCVIYLKPHFQLDQLVSSIKLVTELAVGHVGN
ncbi:type VI secretion system contractile sheath large subunit [Aurantivibrio plasticivorans]